MPWDRRPGGPVIDRAVWNANQAAYTRWAWARRGWAFLVLVVVLLLVWAVHALAT